MVSTRIRLLIPKEFRNSPLDNNELEVALAQKRTILQLQLP